VVKTRHSLSCLEKLPEPEGRSILRLRLELFSVGFANDAETPKKPSPIELDIIGTTSANWNGERKVHPSALYSMSLRHSGSVHWNC
jgi:hypothetical protein